ncbi:hypothetical protein N5B55_04690 [Ralstonia pickettii]|uniref:hypothetical protein n=1 Tax=Ralstonia pickettii TaxID=329 RepID=UPI0027145311|nr:hypothetical protein [Ralstonia pickettii]WKZ86250.1 hypothetical protein N5B55_04690 [Ralstonia pickettii]
MHIDANSLDYYVSKIEPTTKRGRDLEAGDVIEVWWKPRRDIITALRPYNGPIECLRGGFLADFAINRVGMTIEPDALYRVVASSAIKEKR